MKSVLYAIFCLMLFLSMTYAQQAPRTISLDVAVQIALERNISVIQQQNNFDGQQSNVTAAYGGLMPSLSAYGNWQRTANQTNEIFVNGATLPYASSTTSNNFSTGVRASMTLFDGFSTTSNISRATSSAVSAEQDLYRTKQSTVYQAEGLYLSVLRNDALMRTAEDNLKRDQRQLDQIVEMNKLGAKAIADVYRQRYQVGNDELSLIQAKNSLEKSKADLVLYLGLSVTEDFDFSDPTIKSDIDTTEFAPLNAQYKDFQGLTAQAFAVRPDYLSAIEQRDAASSNITIQRGSYFPSVSGSVSYGLNSPAIDKLNNNKTLSWGLSVSLPLFNGFQRENQVQQAQVAYHNAEAGLANTERSVQVDIKKALLDLDAAMKAINVSNVNVLSADEDRKIQEEKYRLGASTLLDLLTANANYTTALSNKINAVYNYILAKKNVELAVGTVKY